jgi:hypothetical protein
MSIKMIETPKRSSKDVVSGFPTTCSTKKRCSKVPITARQTPDTSIPSNGSDIPPQHEELSMGHVYHPHYPEDQGQASSGYSVGDPMEQASQEYLEDFLHETPLPVPASWKECPMA